MQAWGLVLRLGSLGGLETCGNLARILKGSDQVKSGVCGVGLGVDSSGRSARFFSKIPSVLFVPDARVYMRMVGGD